MARRCTKPLELKEFEKRALNEIREGMMATKKYSKRFVNGIIAGLRRSNLYVSK